MMAANQPGNEQPDILAFDGIGKSFHNVKALTEVGFTVRQGEVHALLGENGAGKSTLLNILTGVFPPDAGKIYLQGTATEIRNPAHAKTLGIAKVHQELQLVPELTVGQNIFLGSEPRIGGTFMVNWNELHRRAGQVLQRLDADFGSRDVVKRLSTAQMQMVEIAKALQRESKLLLMDEPTSSLTNVEIEKLFAIIHRLRAAGTTILYVSHRLEEVFQIADRLTVLRDGRYMGTYPVDAIDKPGLIRLMVGRDLNEFMKTERRHEAGEVLLEVRRAALRKGGPEVSFTVRRGEILGVAGLVGSGRTEIMRAVFGADSMQRGQVLLRGKPVSIGSPEAAIRHGLALVPEDRKRQGFVSLLSNRSNICLPSLPRLMTAGLISAGAMDRTARTAVEKLRIMPPDIRRPTGELSGGNQQKVVLGKWLGRQAELFIFDEPTRGIDVGAKSEIYRLMHELAAEGKAIIMISSDLPEIIGMSDRILVMHEGAVRGELAAGEATEEKILRIAMGGN